MPKRSLLFAYDGSPGARHAIEAASELVEGGDALVLYVAEQPSAVLAPVAGLDMLPPPPVIEEATPADEDAARAVAQEGVELAAEAGFRAEPLTSSASGARAVAQVIRDVADEHDVELIVLGSRGRSGIASVLLGSVANSVVHETTRPTLTIPEPR